MQNCCRFIIYFLPRLKPMTLFGVKCRCQWTLAKLKPIVAQLKELQGLRATLLREDAPDELVQAAIEEDLEAAEISLAEKLSDFRKWNALMRGADKKNLQAQLAALMSGLELGDVLAADDTVVDEVA